MSWRWLSHCRYRIRSGRYRVRRWTRLSWLEQWRTESGYRRLQAELVDDCEAFLLADLAERLERRHDRVPVWVWTNLLAHGSEPVLRREQSTPSGQFISDERWRHARAYLAGELLDQARRYGSLASLQQAVLIPLELELASRPEVARWSPGQWVAIVEGALNNHAEGADAP